MAPLGMQPRSPLCRPLTTWVCHLGCSAVVRFRGRHRAAHGVWWGLSAVVTWGCSPMATSAGHVVGQLQVGGRSSTRGVGRAGATGAAGASSFFRRHQRKKGQPGGVLVPFFQLPPAEERSAFPLFTALQCLSSAFFRFLPFASSFLPYASTPLEGWKRKGRGTKQTPSKVPGVCSVGAASCR